MSRTTADSRLEERAKVIKAMAHPSRLLMVESLAESEKCVCELTELVGADISTVSKHLSLLKNAGIVQDERRGTQIFYTLRCPCILGFFDCVERVLSGDTTPSEVSCLCQKSED